MDFVLSLLMLILLSPLLMLVALVIRLSMGSPILFRQVRIGMGNRPFSIYKFRTMILNTPDNLSDRQRLTKVGAVIRKTSIDELPQMINILKGDMSFIGPRPLLPEYLHYYNAREIMRHKVRPGMSSLAGVMGRSNLTWEEQFEMDIQYVENLSFLLDLGIFLKTIPRVLGNADVMVVGRKDPDRFDVYRKKQRISCKASEHSGQ